MWLYSHQLLVMPSEAELEEEIKIDVCEKMRHVCTCAYVRILTHILEKTCACIPTVLCVLRVFCAVCAFPMGMFGPDGCISYESYGPL